MWVIFIAYGIPATATHYRAGEITYRLIDGRRYEITAITYTDPTSRADGSTSQIVIDWGDGSTSLVQRWSTLIYADNPSIRLNIYKAIHQYATDATYEIGMMDRNRINGILNINGGNTVDLAFYVSSIVKVNMSIGNNQSPVLLNPPIDKGCNGFVYVHNPVAYDADGDSLVFKLIPPKIAPGENVPNYSTPAASDSFSLDSRTGRIYWSKPVKSGYYNIAIEVTEFRVFMTNGIRDVRPVGQVVRDMQIYIDVCDNSPPVLDEQSSACVKVGYPLIRQIRAVDPNPGQIVRITPLGGPFTFQQQGAFINPNPGIGQEIATTRFNWTPGCNAIRYDPYQILFRAKDDYSMPLTDYNGFYVKVIAPEPRNVQALQSGNNALQVSWTKDSCAMATKYYVYRRIDSSHWNPDICERGVPDYTGFKKIGELQTATNPDDTVLIDNNKNQGLSPLIRYCYRVVAVYPARNESGGVIGGMESESFASAEVCNTIIRSKPIITKASIRYTDSLMGSVQLDWIRPDTLDTLAYKPPYQLIFKRGTQANALTSFASATYLNFSAISDSSLIDSMLNTRDKMYWYEIELKASLNGEELIADRSPSASTLRTNVYSTDNANILSWSAAVPWLNDSFVVYRENTAGDFEEIARTNQAVFADTGLINGVEYCYRIESIGKYPLYPLRIANFSQRVCGIPVDTIPPCPPILTIVPPCSDFQHYENILTWIPQNECANDVVKYLIYFKPNADSEFELISTVSNAVQLFVDVREILKKSIAGCYAVIGVDSFENRSSFANTFCIDNCPEYRLPNVFTPNDDQVNDLFLPFPYRFIDHIQLQIFNRWGEEVFHTDNIDVLWDGKDLKSGNPVNDGIYFYVCEVYENYLNGLRKRIIRGTVQIIR